MLLLIDNYDSFTYNLAQYFGELGCDLLVKRNDEISLDEIGALTPERICISPGPCTPREAGISKDIILRFGAKIPILGVCLGHQCIGEAYGGKIVRAARLVHGKSSTIRHNGDGLFFDLPTPFDAGRYHSLVVERSSLPGCLEIVAESEDDEIMIGFNFYPQSPRYIRPGAVRQIVEAISSGVCAVGVFVDAGTEEIRTTANAAGVRCVQLHGRTSPATCRELAREFRVIRAFATDPQFRPEQVSLFNSCDVLIDAHHPSLRGGTGVSCDWLAARKTRSFARFLILSGGLTEQNVGQAIAAVGPHADVQFLSERVARAGAFLHGF